MSDMAIHGTSDAQWVNIDSDKDIHVHAANDETILIDHDQMTTVTNDKTLIVNGKHTETINGDTAIEIKQGELSCKVTTNGSSLIANKRVWIESSTDYIYESAKTHINLEVGANTVAIQDSGDIISKADSTIEMSVAGNVINIAKDGNINVTANTKITLAVGSNSIVMDSSGITLTGGGNSIKIDGSGIALNGGSLIKATAGTINLNS
jgi:type VI secretion system secreted protein VgrG